MEKTAATATMEPQPRQPDTGARLGTALLAYWIGVTLIVTLVPFHFAWPDTWRLSFGGDPFAGIVSVLLFIPFGFLHRLAAPGERKGSMLLAVTNAAFISIAIEAMQLFDATR